MGAKDNLSTVIEKVLDCGESADNSLIACDNAILKGNVKIASYKNFLACNANVFNGFLVVSHSLFLLFFIFSHII